jgi:hypothetical protein
MRLYCQEADRQVRVYGLVTVSASSASSMTPVNTPAASTPQPSQFEQSSSQQPRGLAAIPLLCAAASESRQAYLRRLGQTPLRQAWWRRQEPLTATPGTVWAFPEHALLGFASLLEHISLRNQTTEPPIPILSMVPAPVLQSLLWPLHNSLLALWMGFILVATAWTAELEIIQTILLGSRRTGWSLKSVWKDQVVCVSQSVHTLTETHQPLTARLIGLLLLPLTLLIQLAGWTWSDDEEISSMKLMGTCAVYTAALFMTWWYWFVVLPFLIAWWLSAAFVTGQCYALIEVAGV